MLNRNLRDIIFERDSYTCIFCRRPAADLHHVIKRSQGGRDNPQNLVSVCRVCHEVIHGTRVQGVEISREEAAQLALEYLHDYYAPEFQSR